LMTRLEEQKNCQHRPSLTNFHCSTGSLDRLWGGSLDGLNSIASFSRVVTMNMQFAV
jgi:hypothetical protein